MATFVLDCEHRVQVWNRACEKLTGMPAEAVLGTRRHWRGFYPAERPCLADIVLDQTVGQLPTLYASWGRSALIADGLHAEGWFENLSGERRYLVLDASVVLDPQGAVLGAVETIRDQTAAKRAEQEVSRLAKAVEHSAEGILIADAGGEIQYMNPALETMTGYRLEEVLGQTPRVFRSGRQSRQFYREMWRTVAGGEVWRGQLTNARKDGTMYQEDCTISPVCDETGAVSTYVAVKRDLTQQLALERRLYESQKLETMGAIARGVAHDFNNLLTVILVQGERLLQRLEVGDRMREVVQDIVTAGEQAQGLTEQLLSFNRRRAGKPRPVNINQVIRETGSMLRRLLGVEYRLVFDLDEQAGWVRADPQQIQQVVLNLIVNARDAMPEGGTITLETRARCRELALPPAEDHARSAVGWVRLRVSDTGCGMDAATRERIFEPLFTTKGEDRGTGLGLFTVHGIVEECRGRIRVVSSPGRGSTFSIYLPEASGDRQGQRQSRGNANPSRSIPAGVRAGVALEGEGELDARAAG